MPKRLSVETLPHSCQCEIGKNIELVIFYLYNARSSRYDYDHGHGENPGLDPACRRMGKQANLWNR